MTDIEYASNGHAPDEVAAPPAQLVSARADELNAEISNATEQIRLNLDALTREPLADVRVEIAHKTVEWFDYLSGLTGGLLAEAGDVLQDVAEQRDKVLADLRNSVASQQELVEAIVSQDPNHPLVYELMTLVREDEQENLDEKIHDAEQTARLAGLDDGYDDANVAMEEKLAEHLSTLFSVDLDIAADFAHDLARGFFTRHDVSPNRAGAIGQALKEAYRNGR